MDPRTQQKLAERSALDAFLRAVHLQPMEVEDDRESPDFALTLPGRRIGLELTSYVRGQSPDPGGSLARENEAQHDRIVARAQKLYEATHEPAVSVSVFWHHGRPALPERRLAELLVSLVRGAIPDFGGNATAQSDVTWDGLPPELREIVRQVNITRWADGHKMWSSPEGGIISVSKEEIVNCIAIKERKLTTYTGAWDEIWLLIYATDKFVSEMMELRPEAMNAEYRTGFARVYVLQRSRADVVRLRLIAHA